MSVIFYQKIYFFYLGLSFSMNFFGLLENHSIIFHREPNGVDSQNAAETPRSPAGWPSNSLSSSGTEHTPSPGENNWNISSLRWDVHPIITSKNTVEVSVCWDLACQKHHQIIILKALQPPTQEMINYNKVFLPVCTAILALQDASGT